MGNKTCRRRTRRHTNADPSLVRVLRAIGFNLKMLKCRNVPTNGLWIIVKLNSDEWCWSVIHKFHQISTPLTIKLSENEQVWPINSKFDSALIKIRWHWRRHFGSFSALASYERLENGGWKNEKTRVQIWEYMSRTQLATCNLCVSLSCKLIISGIIE